MAANVDARSQSRTQTPAPLPDTAAIRELLASMKGTLITL
jgi:hypothetical protein